jgi:hypothetical protein
VFLRHRDTHGWKNSKKKFIQDDQWSHPGIQGSLVLFSFTPISLPTVTHCVLSLRWPRFLRLSLSISLPIPISSHYLLSEIQASAQSYLFFTCLVEHVGRFCLKRHVLSRLGYIAAPSLFLHFIILSLSFIPIPQALT